MKKHLLTVLALALMTTGFAYAPADADQPKLEASKTGKDPFCRVKYKLKNEVGQTIQIDRLRVISSKDDAFFSEFELSGSRYRPVSGATVPTPMVDVMVPAGHQVYTEVTYRKQITAGKNPKFSAPKTDKIPNGAIQPGCSLAGQELTVGVQE